MSLKRIQTSVLEIRCQLYRVNPPKLRSLKGVIGEVGTSKKLYGRGCLKCNPGEIFAKYWFFGKFYKKILKNQRCILGKIFVWQSCSQLNKLSNNVHITPVDSNFEAVKVHQSQNFHFFLPIFWLWRPFWYGKGPIDLCFF